MERFFRKIFWKPAKAVFDRYQDDKNLGGSLRLINKLK